MDVTNLPVRTGSDEHLSDSLMRPGCALCRERAREEAVYLESILAESVNDVGFRRALDAARGFCPRHCRALLAADRRGSGMLGAAILLRATLATRLRELEAAHAAGGRARARRTREAARPPRCPVCERAAVTDGIVVSSLVALAEDPGWAAVAAEARFCLRHLVALMDQRPVPGWWPAVEARQLDRLRELRDRLDRYVQASAHDRSHLQTDDQRASVPEVADLLGRGRPGDEP
jgi:hypothetical protein